MSRSDLSQLIAQAVYLLQNQEAFDRLLDSLSTISPQQKNSLRSAYIQLTSGALDSIPAGGKKDTGEAKKAREELLHSFRR